MWRDPHRAELGNRFADQRLIVDNENSGIRDALPNDQNEGMRSRFR
jgi:hypothetical protein